jgi:acetyl-CoA carboxylase biotin carboxylase subunit
LIGKLIVLGRTREECIKRLNRCLHELVITGVDTTIPLFEDLVENETFLSGDYNINWLEKYLADAS